MKAGQRADGEPMRDAERTHVGRHVQVGIIITETRAKGQILVLVRGEETHDRTA